MADSIVSSDSNTSLAAPDRQRTAGGLDLAAFIGLWILYALLVRRFWFLVDDAYISFRFSKHWAQGHGIRFNLGDHAPVEGYSNFLHVAVGALIERLGLDIELWMPWLCFACGGALLFLVFYQLRAALETSLPVACVSTAFLALSPPFAVWSTSGLETMPFTLFLFASFERLILRRGGVDPWGGAALGLLTALTRIEGICWALLLVPIAAFSRRARGQPALRPLAAYLIVLACAYGVYFFWRASYFGHAVPATVHAKLGLSAAGLSRGFSHVVVQFLTCLPLFLLLPGSLAALRRHRFARAAPAALLALGFPAFAVVVGGDFMTFGRFLVPGLPFTALLIAWLLSNCGRPVAIGAFSAGLIALGLLPAWNLHPVPESLRARFHFRLNTERFRSELEQWNLQRTNAIKWGVKGRALQALAGPGGSAVLSAVGAAGYQSDLFIFDRLGLVSTEVSMRPDKGESVPRSPGHDHPIPSAWFVERGYSPTFLRARILQIGKRRKLLQEVTQWRSALGEELGANSRYQFDIFALPMADNLDDVLPLYLFLWRRLAEGAESSQARARLEDKLERLARTGELERVPIEPFDAAELMVRP